MLYFIFGIVFCVFFLPILPFLLPQLTAPTVIVCLLFCFWLHFAFAFVFCLKIYFSPNSASSPVMTHNCRIARSVSAGKQTNISKYFWGIWYIVFCIWKCVFGINTKPNSQYIENLVVTSFDLQLLIARLESAGKQTNIKTNVFG